MVQGIEKFKKYFSEFTGQYVFIGGTACEIILDDMGSSFRATKDLEIEYIILFKIRAWLDLSKRKERGESVDSKDLINTRMIFSDCLPMFHRQAMSG